MIKLNIKKKRIKSLLIVLALITICILFLGFLNLRKTRQDITNTYNDYSQAVQSTSQNDYETENIWQWQHDIPENHNLDGHALSTLHTTLDSTQVNSAIVIKNGYIVDEYYKQGYDEESVFPLYSCSKSITSALIGIAIDKGYIENVNIPISNYFPEILESDKQYLKQITIWNLLTHTSGINASDTDNWEEWIGSENWVDYVLNTPVTSIPGTVFNYFTGNTHLLSAILQKATGKSVYEFGKENLFEPLKMSSVECQTDSQGISDGGNGFSMNVYDMAKFGQLFLNNGVWENQQIISEQWVKDSTSNQYSRKSGTANYGYQWWVRNFGEQNYESYFAQGHFGQFIFIVPKLELIIVFTSHNTGNTNMYWQFVNNIVNACQE